MHARQAKKPIYICKIKISVECAMNASWILLLRLLGVQEERQETREAATTTGACALAAKRAGAVTSHAQAATTRVCTLSAKRAGAATSDGGVETTGNCSIAGKLPPPDRLGAATSERGGNKIEASTLEAEKAGAATSNGRAATTTGSCAYDS